MEAVDNSNLKRDKTAILGIFAKQPVPGQCKTRLSPPLTLTEAAELYRCSLRETVQRMQTGSGYELVVCYAGERGWFEREFPGVKLIPQRGVELGARMAVALSDFLQQGHQRAVLVGSDSPDLPLGLVDQAFTALQQAEVVLAPASDGGYVLIGESKHHPQLFENIQWSTAEVLSETLRRIEQLDIPAMTLESWDDLDDLQSLEKFLYRSPQAETALYLKQQLGRLFGEAK